MTIYACPLGYFEQVSEKLARLMPTQTYKAIDKCVYENPLLLEGLASPEHRLGIRRGSNLFRLLRNGAVDSRVHDQVLPVGVGV